MKCSDYIDFIDDFYDGFLDRKTEERIKNHLAHCDACRHAFDNEEQMRHMLKTLPTPLASPRFTEQVIKNAVTESRNKSRFRTAVSMCGGIAAAIALWLTVSLPPTMHFFSTGKPETTADMNLEIQQSTTIRMVINVPHDMLNSTVTVRVPQHLEVIGFPGMDEISWDTDLLKGKNLLELPVMAKKSGKSTLITQIDYQNKRKTLTLITQVPSSIQKSELKQTSTG